MKVIALLALTSFHASWWGAWDTKDIKCGIPVVPLCQRVAGNEGSTLAYSVNIPNPLLWGSGGLQNSNNLLW